MIVAIGNWELKKADKQPDYMSVNVRMVANSMSPDKEDDEIVPQAFNEQTVKEFIENGIIDWHHQSLLGKTQEERAKAILGKPYYFEWVDNKPVVYATLTKSNPIVKDAILPHLEAGQKVFGASIGGSIRKAQVVWDNVRKKNKRLIMSIVWNHLAIAALPYVISSGTSVEIVKAYGNEDLFVKYSDLSQFKEKISLLYSEEGIRKAIEAGTATNIEDILGGQALQEQDLEGSSDDYIYDYHAHALITLITKRKIEPNKQSIIRHLRSLGMTSKQIDRIWARFKEKVDIMKHNITNNYVER